MFHEIPRLPVVLPLGAAAFVVLIWILRRRHLLSVPRAMVALALCVYFAGVVANTIFPIFLDQPAVDKPWTSGLALVPLADYEAADALMNVLIFVPLGCLIPLVLPAASLGRVLAVATGGSLMIEATQYVTAHVLDGGHIADVNDLLFNVIGAALGYGLLRALSRVPGGAGIIDRLRWTGPSAAGS